MSTTDEQYLRAKSERRRRLQQRQTLIFGSIILVLALALLISWLQWAQIIPSPFAREFTTEDVPRISETYACPAEGTVTVGAAEITTTVLNSTPTAGQATLVSDALKGAGVVVSEVGNWEESVYPGQGVIEVSPNAIAQGYSLQYLLPGFPVMLSDDPESGVTVIIGTAYDPATSHGDPATLVAGTPVTAPAECTALAPTDTPTDAPADAPAPEPTTEAPAA